MLRVIVLKRSIAARLDLSFKHSICFRITTYNGVYAKTHKHPRNTLLITALGD